MRGAGRRVLLALALACAGCAAPVVDVSVSEPKVFGDDQVLLALARQSERLIPLAQGIRPGDYQESFGVRHDSRAETDLALNLADPLAPSAHPRPQQPGPGWGRWWEPGRFWPQPLVPGLSFRDQLRQRTAANWQLASEELLLAGDSTLRDPRSRCVLVRFEVSVNAYADLGSRRRFVVVEFVVRGKGEATPRFGVYLLAPEYAGYVSRERALTQVLDGYAAKLLGSWGGIGLTAGQSASDYERQELETLLETPLQFGIYDSRPAEGAGRRFAFALGPRRRLVERGLLNPARWFGPDYTLAYELQPGPRSCEALLVFRDVEPGQPVEVEVEVFSDGRLVAAEEVDLTPALNRGRPLRTFDVRCPPGASSVQTRTVTLDPTVPTDLLLESDAGGPAFGTRSRVFVGSVSVAPQGVRFLGRGRLAVHVPASATLRREQERGEVVLSGRVVTPDQPDFSFEVRLVGGGQ